MAERPTRRPRFGYDAPSGRMLEPLAGVAAAGFAPGQRPPAEWINYLLHFTTAWCDYLAGPGWGAWERTAHGGSAPTFTGIAGLAVDADDATAALARRRYVLAGATSGGLALAVSRTGREWIARSPPGTATELHGVLAVGSYFLLWGLAGSVAAMWRTQRDDVVPSVSSAITLDDASLWSLVGSFSAPTTGVAAVVRNGTARVGRLLRLANAFAFAFSDDDGATWSAVFDGSGLVSGAIASGLAWDAVRGRWLAASTKGDVALLTVGSNWTLPMLLPSMPDSARVHLRAGGGLCIAWASVDAAGDPLAASRLWRSEDGGETWTAVALPSAWGATLTDVTYADGVWVATTTAAPYLWRSDDGGATWSRVPLPIGEESSWALHRAAFADGAVTATGLTWTVATTRATGLAPDASRVYSPEPGYLADAGYLRGRRIAATAPTDGQGLVWDATGGVWTPGSTSGPAIPDPTGAPDGQVMTTTGGAYGLASPSGGVDTSLQAAPDTGWTAAGAGSAAIASGVVTLSMGAAQDGVGLYREMPASPLGPALEVTARITRTVSTSDYHWFGLGLVRQTPAVGYRLLCQSVGTAVASIDTGGGVSTTGTTAFPGGATLDSGTLWARLVITPTYTAWYVGAGATRPTSWTLMHSRAADVALLASGVVARLALLGGRVTGTGTATAEIADIQWRSLLGAPAP